MIFSISFWFNFILFFVAVIIANFIPGDIVLRKLKLTVFQRLVLGVSAGIILWAWQGLLFGYIHIRWLSYLYLIFFLIIWSKFYAKKFFRELYITLRNIKPDYILLIILVFGVLVQLITVWFNGIFTGNGLFFCCGNTSDNLLQISITDQIIKQIPPYEPGMYGTYIHNYHYLGNLVIAELIRVFNLPLIATQFQYSTVLLSVLLGLNGIVIGKLLRLPRSFIRWLLFFLYFGGDAIYLLTFFLGKGFVFTMSSLEDGSKFLSNYPRAFSIVLFLAGFNLLIIWLKKKDKYSGLIMAGILGSLIGFKVYIGIFALIGLGTLSIFYIFQKKLKLLISLVPALLISILIYLPVNSGAGGLYFTGLWVFENFASQEALGLHNIILAHYIYLTKHNIPRIILDEVFFIFLYIIGIFGTKLICLAQNAKTFSLLGKEINMFLLSGILGSMILGFFFQQKTGGSNTFNFIVSIFIIGSIYSALALSYLTEKMNKKFIKYLFIIAIIIFTIPRIIYEINQNSIRLIHADDFLISTQDLQGFEKLKILSENNELVLVDERAFPLEKDSTYISFIANRRMFLSGVGILNSHGVDSNYRQLTKEIIFNSSDPINIGKALEKNKIDLIITDPQHYLGSTYSAHFMSNIYQNKKVRILKFSDKDFREFLKNLNADKSPFMI
jgi:hypothetical protein